MCALHFHFGCMLSSCTHKLGKQPNTSLFFSTATELDLLPEPPPPWVFLGIAFKHTFAGQRTWNWVNRWQVGLDLRSLGNLLSAPSGWAGSTCRRAHSAVPVPAPPPWPPRSDSSRLGKLAGPRARLPNRLTEIARFCSVCFLNPNPTLEKQILPGSDRSHPWEAEAGGWMECGWSAWPINNNLSLPTPTIIVLSYHLCSPRLYYSPVQKDQWVWSHGEGLATQNI